MEGKLAVCVNAYNAESTIGKVIESLLSQTFKEFYVFIVDNGSTDSTLKICDEYVRALTFSGNTWPDIYVFKGETNRVSLVGFLERIVECMKMITYKTGEDIQDLHFIDQFTSMDSHDLEILNLEILNRRVKTIGNWK